MLVQWEDAPKHAFGMDPAQCVLPDIELSGIITEDDQLRREAVVDETADQGALGGGADRVFPEDAERLEMGVPGGAIVESLWPLLQGGEKHLWQALCPQIVQGGGIDHIVGVRPAQQLQEVDAALRIGAVEDGEVFIAKMGAIAIFSGMASSGVVDVQIGADAKAGVQQGILFLMERRLVFGNQPVELAAGEVDAPIAQLLPQQGLGDPLVMILIEDEAAQGGTEVGAL